MLMASRGFRLRGWPLVQFIYGCDGLPPYYNTAYTIMAGRERSLLLS